MTLIDILLAIPLAWLIYKGWKRGLVREAATLAGVVAGIWASVHLSQWVAELLGLEGESAILIAFFVTFVGAMVLAYLLGRSLEGLMKAAKLSLLNRVAGALLGMCKALCILAVILNGIVMLDKGQALITPDTKERSLLYRPVYATGNRLTESLKQFIADHASQARDLLTDKPSAQ
ncbi:MAG: CvpA family protein [Bacteroidales bacterium]|nr:CvpA family protein [Bacteroidales bacterium]